MKIHWEVSMRLDALHAHWVPQSIGVLQSGFDVVDFDDSLVDGVSHDAIPNVDVTCVPAAELVIGRLDGPFVTFVCRDFEVHGRDNECLHLLEEAELVDYFSKRNVSRLGRSSCCHSLCL